MDWIDSGATTLHEMWDMSLSQNHHMYSHFMSYLMKTAIGISILEPGYKKIEIKPVFFKELSYAKGHIDTLRGKIAVNWEKRDGKVYLKIEIPNGIESVYGNTALKAGTNEFII